MAYVSYLRLHSMSFILLKHRLFVAAATGTVKKNVYRSARTSKKHRIQSTIRNHRLQLQNCGHPLPTPTRSAACVHTTQPHWLTLISYCSDDDNVIMTDQADDEDADGCHTDYETTSDFSETSRRIELLIAQRPTDA